MESHWPESVLRQHRVKRVYVCGNSVEPPVLSHVVNFPRLEIPLRGRYENQIESNRAVVTVVLTPGDALFVPPNCWNLPTWREPMRVMSVLFGRKQLGISIVSSRKASQPQALVAEKFSMPRPLTGPVPRILEAMIELCRTGAPGAGVRAEGGGQRAEGRSPASGLWYAPYAELASALLSCLGSSEFRVASSESTRDSKLGTRNLLEEVCVYLQSHYQYEVTRESVARQFGISPNYLSRVFQVQGHMTFSNYLMHVRADRAKFLLRTYGLKLDDIAARCGYRDTAYFCRVFKRLTKVTPAEYRNSSKFQVSSAPDAKGAILGQNWEMGNGRAELEVAVPRS